MSIFTKAADAFRGAVGRVKFPGRSFVWFDLDHPEPHEIQAEVGDGTGADVLMTPVRWLQRNIVKAPWVELDEAGEPVEDQALTRAQDAINLLTLLGRPNPFYSGDTLLQATVLSLSLDGNAYWIVAKNSAGEPVELWYAPHMDVEPKWPDGADTSQWITHYELKTHNTPQKIVPLGMEKQPRDVTVEDALAVMHFREGIDFDNPRKGLSPLKGLLREIWTDQEAAVFTAALLKNGGIPGVVVSPADKDAYLTEKEAEAAEAKIETKLGRHNRGRPLVMLGPTKVEQFGFSPKELDLSPLRDVAEERVTAALGIPAAVVGFGAGLQQTKVGATMKELRREAWEGAVIPMQRTIGNEVSRCLAPPMGAAAAGFDNGEIEVLRENEDSRAMRFERLVRAGILTRGEARVEMGFDKSTGDDVYLLPISTIEVPAGQIRPPQGAPDAPDDEVRAFWQDYLIKGHSHGGPEDRIIEAAPKRKPPKVVARAAQALDRVRRRAPQYFEERLMEVFADLGRSVATAAREALAEEVADGGGEEKQGEGLNPTDFGLMQRILEATDTQAAQAELSAALEAGYLGVSTEVAASLSDTMGFVFELDDPAQRQVMREGGLRAGLIDLDQQTRDAIFDALESGRAEGMAGDNLARHIREHVEAGPWRDAATRARVIARTEGANAALTSTLQAARGMPETEHVMVFDDRTGFGDEGCVAADGTVITIDEADAIRLGHPHCTRSFTPVNSVLMEEMGL